MINENAQATDSRSVTYLKSTIARRDYVLFKIADVNKNLFNKMVLWVTFGTVSFVMTHSFLSNPRLGLL